MLIDEGYDERKMSNSREIYHYTMVFLKDAAERAEKKLLELHPDKDILLDAFCPNPKQEKTASNYKSDEKPSVTLNLKKEHYIVLILVIILLFILFKG